MRGNARAAIGTGSPPGWGRREIDAGVQGRTDGILKVMIPLAKMDAARKLLSFREHAGDNTQ
jgi:hypothetical protein